MRGGIYQNFLTVHELLKVIVLCRECDCAVQLFLELTSAFKYFERYLPMQQYIPTRLSVGANLELTSSWS